jgi:hypothetical protein
MRAVTSTSKPNTARNMIPGGNEMPKAAPGGRTLLANPADGVALELVPVAPGYGEGRSVTISGRMSHSAGQ